jgi:hypothetical protein
MSIAALLLLGRLIAGLVLHGPTAQILYNPPPPPPGFHSRMGSK